MIITMTGPKGEDFGTFKSDVVPRAGEQISIVGAEFVVVQKVTYFANKKIATYEVYCEGAELDVKLLGT